jgi:hypothetical protein
MVFCSSCLGQPLKVKALRSVETSGNTGRRSVRTKDPGSQQLRCGKCRSRRVFML